MELSSEQSLESGHSSRTSGAARGEVSKLPCKGVGHESESDGVQDARKTSDESSRRMDVLVCGVAVAAMKLGREKSGKASRTQRASDGASVRADEAKASKPQPDSGRSSAYRQHAPRACAKARQCCAATLARSTRRWWS